MTGLFLAAGAITAVLLAGTPLFPIVVALLVAAISYRLLTGSGSLPTVA